MPRPLFATAFLPAPQRDDAPPPLTDADRAAVTRVRSLGGQVLEVAQGDPRLDVSFHLGGVTLTPEHTAALRPLAGRVVELNLRGTNLDDELAATLADLTALERLHLEKTAVTDAALRHVAPLPKLTYLNLYGTAVTDAGLDPFAGVERPDGLKLYVWETRVTVPAALSLMERRPGIEVIGLDFPKVRRPLEAPKPAKPAP